MSKPRDASKRRLLGGTLVLGGTALGSSMLTAAASAAASHKLQKQPAAPAPLFDPTLENYPGYSAHIAVPETLKADGDNNDGLNAL